jgi:hypothetical protein
MRSFFPLLSLTLVLSWAALGCGDGAAVDVDAVVPVAELGVDAGNIFFQGDWSENVYGALRQGGTLDVHYDISRLPACRGTHNGYPAWDVIGYARFLPGGEQVEASVRELVADQGRPTNEAHDKLWTLTVPQGATEVELWFKNYTGAGSSCVAWDSNWGGNYRFDLWPAADDPRCRNVEKETGAHTEAEQMVHMAPSCVGYDLDVQYDASYCELYVDGFGDGTMGHYGIPVSWLVGYLSVGHQDGELLGAGMYTRFHGREGGAPGERYSFGQEVAPGAWKVGFSYNVTAFMGVTGVDVVADEVAFFIDVRRPSGKVVRLWQSRHGVNYRVGDVFAPGVVNEGIPYGNMRWARDDSEIFESRNACR